MKSNCDTKLIKKNSIYLAESKEFLNRNFNGYKNTNWHIYYSAFNGILSNKYIPEYLFFAEIEPTLNNFNFYKAYADKSSYDYIFNKQNLPKTIIKIINGSYFNENSILTSEKDTFALLLNCKENLVFKPAIISGQGRNVIIDSPQTIVTKLKRGNYKKYSYVIQEKIKQHSEIAAFHPKSVNTYRITTARIKTGIVVLSSYFRIGRNNSIIDNGMAGGMMCGIDSTGKITDYAFDFKLQKMFNHPDTKKKFSNFVCPAYEDACNLCKDSHSKLLHYTIVSWDIAINQQSKPISIELNLKNQAITGHQLVHGPLFGEYTEQLLEQYKRDYKKNLLYY